MNKIQKFIKENNLDFSGFGSDLNGACVALAGYALHLNGDQDDFGQLLADIEEDGRVYLTSEASEELERVSYYAYQNNYADWWQTKEAKKQYIF